MANLDPVATRRFQEAEGLVYRNANLSLSFLIIISHYQYISSFLWLLILCLLRTMAKPEVQRQVYYNAQGQHC